MSPDLPPERLVGPTPGAAGTPDTIDDRDLDRALRAVKARSDRRRQRQWATAAAIVIVIGATSVVALRTSSAPDVSVASGAGGAGGAGTTSPDGHRTGGSTAVTASTGDGAGADGTGGPAGSTTTTTTTTPGGPTTSVAASTTDTSAPPTTSLVDSSTSTTTPATSMSTSVEPPATTPTEPGVPSTTTTTPFTMARALDEARALWAARRPARYSMTLGRSCFCDPDFTRPIDVVVDGTTIVSPTGLTHGTVDDLYEEAAALGPDGRLVRLDVDPATGVPLALSLDRILQAADDEMYYTISNFTPLP